MVQKLKLSKEYFYKKFAPILHEKKIRKIRMILNIFPIEKPERDGWEVHKKTLKSF